MRARTLMDERKDQCTKKPPLYPPNVKLKHLRELRGWSQAYVADQIGCQSNLVTRWETGVAFPSPYYRQKLCTLFGKNAAELGLIKPGPATPVGDEGMATIPADKVTGPLTRSI